MQGPVLMQFPQLGGDSIAVIWTMVDRHDPDSQWLPFWQSLPGTLQSGLSMAEELLQVLEGLPDHAECVSACQVDAVPQPYPCTPTFQTFKPSKLNF